MTALVWDAVGDRIFQAGVDRGVLYISHPGFVVGVAWNGLVSVEERFTPELKSFYLDGVKYLEHLLPGDYTAELKAYTYPDEFEQVIGIQSRPYGLSIHDQNPIPFSLSYRTRIGDDIQGTDRGYRIHLLYNLRAVPENTPYLSQDAAAKPVEFGWTLTGIPVAITGFRPTVHISFDSTAMDPDVLAIFEGILYGSDSVAATLPTIADIIALFTTMETLTIVDNGDGTWTATGGDAELVMMLDATTFQIRADSAVYLDANTYQIPTT